MTSPGSSAGADQTASEVRWLKGRRDVLEIVLRGAITGADVLRVTRDAGPLLAAAPPRSVFIDTTLVTRYDPGVRRPAAELFEALRARGTASVVLVTTARAIRMISTAIAFAARLPIEVYSTHADALRVLDARRPTSVER